MSQENQVTLRGYLTADPKLYQKTSEAVPLTELRVGCTPRRINRATGEWQDLPTSYFKVKCWRRLAINAASSLHKGDQVLIRGKFFTHNWVDNQQRPRSTIEIEADTLGHDLAYGWSHFLHGTRSSGSGAAVNSGEAARQDTEAPVSADGDGEFPPDADAHGPDEPDEAVPALAGGDQDTGERGQPGFAGFTNGSRGDADGQSAVPGVPQARPAEDVVGGQPADGEAGDIGPAPGVPSDVDSLEGEPVPF